MQLFLSISPVMWAVTGCYFFLFQLLPIKAYLGGGGVKISPLHTLLKGNMLLLTQEHSLSLRNVLLPGDNIHRLLPDNSAGVILFPFFKRFLIILFFNVLNVQDESLRSSTSSCSWQEPVHRTGVSFLIVRWTLVSFCHSRTVAWSCTMPTGRWPDTVQTSAQRTSFCPQHGESEACCQLCAHWKCVLSKLHFAQYDLGCLWKNTAMSESGKVTFCTIWSELSGAECNWIWK